MLANPENEMLDARNRSLELLWIWTWREIKVRYKQSVLGFAWAVFQPLALTCVFIAVFSLLIRFPSDGHPYPIFVYSAMLPWTFFARGVGASASAIVANARLITKVNVENTVFPIAVVLTYVVDFLCGLTIFALLMIFYQFPLNSAMLLLPGLFVLQLLLMIGLALGMSALNVYFRDITQMMPLVLQLWMYSVPIIYPLSTIPERFRSLYLLNPMATLIHSYRTILLEGKLSTDVSLTVTVLTTLVVFVLGYNTFRRLENRFADVI